MIKRVWRGWTSPENAPVYEKLLLETIVPAIAARDIPGHLSTEVLRRVDGRDGGREIEFMTVMTFEDWTAVEEFAGPDATGAVVPAAARAVLSRFDEHSAHYEERLELPAPS